MDVVFVLVLLVLDAVEKLEVVLVLLVHVLLVLDVIEKLEEVDVMVAVADVLVLVAVLEDAMDVVLVLVLLVLDVVEKLEVVLVLLVHVLLALVLSRNWRRWM